MGTDRAEGWGGDKRMKIEYTYACDTGNDLGQYRELARFP